MLRAYYLENEWEMKEKERKICFFYPDLVPSAIYFEKSAMLLKIKAVRNILLTNVVERMWIAN